MDKNLRRRPERRTRALAANGTLADTNSDGAELLCDGSVHEVREHRDHAPLVRQLRAPRRVCLLDHGHDGLAGQLQVQVHWKLQVPERLPA
eukprot:3486672-Rhodomonas_salina.2